MIYAAPLTLNCLSDGTPCFDLTDCIISLSTRSENRRRKLPTASLPVFSPSVPSAQAQIGKLPLQCCAYC
ncbi:hypothetical protein GUJ93_ZPchr0007g3489 [Zizania palustris]|uniref:Uncharacterized protein n=1 Tax=Zizania palustris TaxID=103762 RepID=A0A8J5T5J3_ZIZPA|nr:hypothetical protein GUJ93_ZPchr0007g3489 [Zizania palustris]